MKKNGDNRHFFAKKFGGIKKKHYLCRHFCSTDMYMGIRLLIGLLARVTHNGYKNTVTHIYYNVYYLQCKTI